MSKQKRGKFIAIDGGEGSGKTSVMEFLKGELQWAPVVFTREPGGTEIAEVIRNVALSKEYTEEMNAVTELFLMCAARMQHVKNKILPALERGTHVITDRFSLSTYAYQLWGQDRLELFSQLTQMDAMARGAVHNGHALVGALKIDLQIVLDVDPTVGLARIAKRKGETTRFDEKDIEFHKRVRGGFLNAQGQDNTVIIDTCQDQDIVQKSVLSLIRKTLLK